MAIKMINIGSVKTRPSSAPKAAPKASPNPAKAASRANVKVVFGTPTKQKK